MGGQVPTPAGSVGELVLRLVVFVTDHLRDRGLAVSSSEAIDAARGLALVDLTSQAQVRSALRATLAKDAAAAAALEQLLDRLLPAQRPPRFAPTAAGADGPPPVSDTLGGGDLARAIYAPPPPPPPPPPPQAIHTF